MPQHELVVAFESLQEKAHAEAHSMFLDSVAAPAPPSLTAAQGIHSNLEQHDLVE